MPKRMHVAVVGTALVGSALLVQASVASASDDTSGGDHGRSHETTLVFDVQFSPFSYTDLGEPGPGAADMIVFNDQLLRDGRTVGHEVGNCVVVDASGLANCTAVITLDDGTITFALENSPPPRKALAVTGGSGAYRLVRGDGVLVEDATGPTGTLTLHLNRG
jgi:allene oxide cyclase-like protein